MPLPTHIYNIYIYIYIYIYTQLLQSYLHQIIPFSEPNIHRVPQNKIQKSCDRSLKYHFKLLIIIIFFIKLKFKI